MNFKTLFLAVALLAVTPMCFAVQFIIDDFTQGNIGATFLNNGQTLNNVQAGVGDINATRTLDVLADNGVGFTVVQLDTASQTFTSAAGGGGTTSVDIAYSNLGVQDFTAGGANTFFLLTLSTDLANFQNFDLIANDGNSTVNFDITAALNAAAQQAGQDIEFNFLVDFNDFAGINFTTITDFSFDILSGVNQDFDLTFVQTANNVPEPGTYFMIALLGLVAFVRGRKKMVVENK